MLSVLALTQFAQTLGRSPIGTILSRRLIVLPVDDSDAHESLSGLDVSP